MMPDDPKNDAWRSQKLCLTIFRHNFWDSFWDPKNLAWQLAVHDISRDSGYAGKLQATISWFQILTACWNYTKLLRSNSEVATSWYVLFCTANCQGKKWDFRNNPRNDAWRSSDITSGIVSEIPKMLPDNKLYRRVHISWWPLGNRIWAVQYSFNMQLASEIKRR